MLVAFILQDEGAVELILVLTSVAGIFTIPTMQRHSHKQHEVISVMTFLMMAMMVMMMVLMVILISLTIRTMTIMIVTTMVMTTVLMLVSVTCRDGAADDNDCHYDSHCGMPHCSLGNKR